MATRPVKAINGSRGKELAVNLAIADHLWRRVKGLIGRKSWSGGDAGLLITPCRGVHTFGMRFPIDILFLDHKNMVIAVSKEVAANRLLPVHLSTNSVLELPAGKIAETGTRLGDLIIIDSQVTLTDRALSPLRVSGFSSCATTIKK